jgi:hypothetical protein
MSTTPWFYADAQRQQIGPVTFAQIQELAASGQIQASTLIWKEGMPSWTAASQVDGVFHPAPAQTAAEQSNPYATPAADKEVAPTHGGIYPIPRVKKCSFPLYFIMFALSVVFGLAAFVPVLTKMKEAVQEMPAPTTQPETREEARQAQEEMAEQMKTQLKDHFTEGDLLRIGVLGLGALLFSLITLILGSIYLYRAWFILQPGGPRTTPGKAVGFMFIPLFNFYWIFVSYYGWSQDWNRIQGSHQNLASMPKAAGGLFLTGCICFVATLIPILGYLALILFYPLLLVMLAKMCRVVNSMAAASSQPY